MSNLAKIYSELTGAGGLTQKPTVEEPLDAGTKELKFNWLNSTVTQEMFKEIVKGENDLIDFAIEQSCKSNPDNIKILQLLIRVDTLRKLRKEYSNQPKQ